MNRWIVVVALASLCMANVSHAKQAEDYRHSYDQVWRTAIRLIRVDQRFPIRDRDEAIGFVLFDYVDNDHKYPGSVELVRTKDGDEDRVRVVMQIPAMPSYIEQMLLDKLERKLEREYGEPPRPIRREPADDAEDAPKSDDSDEDDDPPVE